MAALMSYKETMNVANVSPPMSEDTKEDEHFEMPPHRTLRKLKGGKACTNGLADPTNHEIIM